MAKMVYYLIFLLQNLKIKLLNIQHTFMRQKKKIGKEIIIYSGNIIKFDDIKNIKDRRKLTDFLKNKTYDLINNE